MLNSGYADFENSLSKYSFDDLWMLKGIIEKKIQDLSPNKLTQNYTGERAVDLAIEWYNKTTNLPSLERAAISTKDFDAYSKSTGKRYSIKGYKGNNKTSSAICAFNDDKHDYNFEYVLLVKMNDFYQLEEILQIPLEVALKYKSRNSRDNNFKLTYTRKMRNDADTLIVYSNLECQKN